MSEEQLIKIKQQTGNFNLADPSETTTKVMLKINHEDLELDHSFTFKEGEIDVRGMKWEEAIDEMDYHGPRGIRERSKLDEVVEWLGENIDLVREKWREHRIEQIESRAEKLEEEKEDLKRKCA